MPATFVVLSPNNASGLRKRARGKSFKSTGPLPNRHKRSQVTTACDWCRVHRTKCDDDLPCQNCQIRQGRCARRERNKTRTLPGAVREIERLEDRIQELERQLQTSTGLVNNTPHIGASSPNQEHDSPGIQPVSERIYEGVHSSTSQSHQSQWYGLLSNFYYISRLKTDLAIALEQPQSDDHIQPNTASKTFISPISSKHVDGTLEETSICPYSGTSGGNLTGTQEDYFLSLFWESYHCTFQILDEGEFREHHRSLWKTSSSSRKDSALVDIILAVCMQYGLAFLPRATPSSEHKTIVDCNDATIAGKHYYRRSQMLLAAQIENPSIMTLQSQILAIKYLCNASYQNTAYSALATAVRTAHVLGLHLEPSEDLPRQQRELRKRLWWTLYCMEGKTCMKLDRPWSAPFPLITCQLPADDRELALISGSNFASYGENLTWLTYTLQMTKMILATRSVFVAFSDKCAAIAASNSGRGIYNDPQSLEACAEFLDSQMGTIRNWYNQVPDAMKTKRKDGGVPFSTDRTALDVELYAPLWLQRQQLMLELLYHNLIMNLHRPFICFPSTFSADKGNTSLPPSTSETVAFPGNAPVAERHANSCIEHAIAITCIMHQVLTGSDTLSGLHEVVHWQWNATLSLVGFILAYPLSPLISEVRATIDNAIVVFETFGNHFAVGAGAASVTQNLVAKADSLTERFHAQSTDLPLEFADGPGSIPPYLGTMSIEDMDLSNQSREVMVLENLPLSGTTDLASSFDQFAGFEQCYADIENSLDVWTSSQY